MSVLTVFCCTSEDFAAHALRIAGNARSRAVGDALRAGGKA